MASQLPERLSRAMEPQVPAAPWVDDGTHTGLSARFEEEVAREAARIRSARQRASSGISTAP